MFIELSDEQRMLEDTVSGLIAAEGVDQHGDISPQLWSRFAELGVLALALPEAFGGLGGPAADLGIVLRQLGKVPGDMPFFAATILGATLLIELAPAGLVESLLPGLLDGSVIVVPAINEPGARYETNRIATLAVPDGRAFRLSGSKSLVPCGALASHFLVTARVEGAAPDGVSVFLVPAGAPGLSVKPYHGHDGTHDADLLLTDVRIGPEALIGTPPAAAPALEALEQRGMAFSCVEAVGAMEQLLADTLDYLRTRRQFGSSIGSFQVLQHAAVDMFIAVEQAKAMAHYALSVLDTEPGDRNPGLWGAKAQLNAAARLVGETAVQLHGAIGMTRECRAGRLFQRLTRFQLRFGDRATCLSRLAATDTSLLAD